VAITTASKALSIIIEEIALRKLFVFGPLRTKARTNSPKRIGKKALIKYPAVRDLYCKSGGIDLSRMKLNLLTRKIWPNIVMPTETKNKLYFTAKPLKF
jgi:hypothetical protein